MDTFYPFHDPVNNLCFGIMFVSLFPLVTSQGCYVCYFLAISALGAFNL